MLCDGASQEERVITHSSTPWRLSFPPLPHHLLSPSCRLHRPPPLPPHLQGAPTAPAAVGPYDEEEYDGSGGDEDEEEEDEGEEEEGEEEGEEEEEEEEEEDGEGGGRVGGGVQSSWTTLQQATTPPSPTWAPSSLPRPPCALPPRSPFHCK